MTSEELLQTAKPILFNTEMVRAILEGGKTVTRRVIKPANPFNRQDYKQGSGLWIDGYSKEDEPNGHIKDYSVSCCWLTKSTYIEKYAPYKANDILYVRETWNICNMDIEQSCITFIYKASEPESEYANTVKVTQEVYEKYADRMCENNPEWHPSIHMPKEAARIFLKVKSVRVERLQEMDKMDAVKEGIDNRLCVNLAHALTKFKKLWNSTIKKADIDNYGWDANPYVWVIEFERIHPEKEV